VAFPHSLSFAYSGDDSLQLDADHLCMVCAGEKLSYWAGSNGRVLGGRTARVAFKALLEELRPVWMIVKNAAYRLEHVGSPAIQNHFDQFTSLLERRYMRFHVVLPAPGTHGPPARFVFGWCLHMGCWPGDCCQTCNKALCGMFFDGCVAWWAVAHFSQKLAGCSLNCVGLCLLRHATLRGQNPGELRGASSGSIQVSS
jgi:hypothetical protein